MSHAWSATLHHVSSKTKLTYEAVKGFADRAVVYPDLIANYLKNSMKIDDAVLAVLKPHLNEIASIYNGLNHSVVESFPQSAESLGTFKEFGQKFIEARKQLKPMLKQHIPTLEERYYPPLEDLYGRLCFRYSGNVAQVLRRGHVIES